MRLALESLPDVDALLEALQEVDISVPPPGKGRTNDDRERWTACRLLATLGATDRLSYPLSVIEGESHDFVVSSRSQQIGIEITEAASQVYERFKVFAEAEPGHYVVDVGHFRPRTPHLSEREMLDILEGSKPSAGFVGYEPEEDWAFFVGEAVHRKLRKLGSRHFRRLSRNWLSIYANPPFSFVNLDRSIDLVRRDIPDLWRTSPSFDAIFVDIGKEIACLSPSGLVRLTTNDLWRSAHNLG